VNVDIYKANEEQISYLRLKRHVEQFHPTNDDGKSFPVCIELGSLPCCKKKNYKIQITEQQQQVGLGPTLLLMVTKQLVWLFFWLTLINLPVFAFFYYGNNSKQSDSVSAYQEYFAMLSLGNIGQQQNACGENNYAIENVMTLSCSFGKLGSFEAFGLSTDDGALCLDLSESEIPQQFLDKQCNLKQSLFSNNTASQ
jgi:hypothetical protein